MRHIAAYMLATLGGNAQPSAADVSSILKSVGINADGASLEKLIAELSGKDVKEVIAQGSKKMASMPAGVAAAPSGAAPAAAAAPAAKEAPKKKEESEEEMGLGLFD